MKVEVYLILSGLAYKVKNVLNPNSAPKGKLPYIEDNGQKVADSDLIINYCQKNYPQNNLDEFLNDKEIYLGRLIQRTFDEHLYWVLIYSRWVEAEGWLVIKQKFFGELPALIRPLISNMVRRKMINSVNYQGLGKHSRDEIYQMGLTDIKSFEAMLDNKRFLFGEKPTSFDAGVYAFLENFRLILTPNPIKSYLDNNETLNKYCQNIKELLNK